MYVYLFYSTCNSIVYQHLRTLMKIHSHSLPFNSYERGTKTKVVKEFIIKVDEPLWIKEGI